MRLSVSTRWTLRYSLAMLVTVAVLAAILLDRVESRFDQDAEMLLDLQVQEVVGALERHPDDLEEFAAWLRDKSEAAAPLVGLGVALLDAEGHQQVASGILQIHPLPVTAELLQAVDENGFFQARLGRSYPHFLTAVPVAGGMLQVAIYSRPFERRARHILRVLRLAVPVSVALTIGFGWWLTRRSLAPISEITDSAQRITASHMEEWIPTAGTGDELDRLAETLNSMMARIRQGIERSREFQTRLARELRAPLLALQREIAALSNDEGLSPLGRRRMSRALDDAEVLAEAVHSMLRLAWSDSGRTPAASVSVPLASLVEEATSNVGPSAERRQIALVIGPIVPATVSGDPFWLHQLFDALLEAAVAGAASDGSVAMRAELREGSDICAITLKAQPPMGEGGAEKPVTGPAAAARLALAREIARAHHGALETRLGDIGASEYRLELPGRSG